MILQLLNYIIIKILWGPVIRDLIMGPILVLKGLFIYCKRDIR